ncbi:hypothetical protein AX777_25855 [Sphingobium yanoikuyae]|uniref:Uncharacterized protein n=1 Tax=Sphingobium yanoikuyae TaxID=13690 RepID=A0A177K4W5_SPHYA|nr:hypothetical protein AX777_25855 [Sphingobium yanoikuyae]
MIKTKMLNHALEQMRFRLSKRETVTDQLFAQTLELELDAAKRHCKCDTDRLVIGRRPPAL